MVMACGVACGKWWYVTQQPDQLEMIEMSILPGKLAQ